jgi:dihydropteroate synthase
MQVKKAEAPLFSAGRTAIMGILNVTPDSFSDGGLFRSVDKATEHAQRMVADGADIIDLGGESTRPGASPVSVDEELERVIPVIEAIRRFSNVPISIDTSKAEVMQAAVAAGASMINDVWSLRRGNALQTAAVLDVPVCLMHMQGDPESMQENPTYTDVTTDVRQFLADRMDACVAAGIQRNKLILDPGFGFGKTREQNFALLNNLEKIRIDKLPLLAGLSRKSMIGQTLGLPVEDRINASIGLALLAARNGANIVRVHDVKQTHDALRMVEAVENTRKVIENK